MTDSMQFGPEWLRNLSRQDNDNTAMVIPKYQLAEHRYGREEMLALFNKTVAAPEPLRSVGGLYLEKTQLPLALIQMSEEESRVWNSTSNNDSSSRGVMKSIASNLSSNATGVTPGLSRGRGTSVDRGRGRSTRGPYHYNTRNYSEEGIETSHPNTAFGRPRIFDRSQSHNSERSWAERNGNVEYNDWNGYNNSTESGLSTSPRKDFGTSMRIASPREDTNWRRRPAKDDDDSWRSSRHGRGYTNWREGGERDREKEKETDGPEPGKDRRWMSRVVSMHSQSNRKNSECKDDGLPEWATESPSEGGGTFDSSGAFHGTNSEDDEPVVEDKTKEKFKNKTVKSNKKEGRNLNDSANNQSIPIEQKKSKMKEKLSTIAKTTVQKTKSHDMENSIQSFSPSYDKTTTTSTNIDVLPQCLSKQNKQQKQPQQQLVNGTSRAPEEYFIMQTVSKDEAVEVDNKSSSQQAQQQQQQQQTLPSEQQMYLQLQQKIECNSSDTNVAAPQKMDGEGDLRILLENAMNYRTSGSCVYRNTSNNNSSLIDSKLLLNPADILNNTISLMNPRDNTKTNKTTSSVNSLTDVHTLNVALKTQSKGKEEDLEGIVGDVVSKLIEEEEKAEKLKKLDSINKWFYRDPQGIVQGPFLSTEMAEWYRLGYFHDKTLMVRRECENNYYPLHELVSCFGGTPFENVTLQNINNYARLPIAGVPVNAIPNVIPPPNVPDEAFLQQHYQSPYDLLYARQHQQVLAAKKRQLAQTPDGMKSLFEQQRLMSQHMNSGPDANASPASIPIIPGYMHPIIPPTLPSTNPNLVLLLSQMQQQQHQHQLQQHLLHQQLHQQQPQPQSLQSQTKDVKQERSQQPSMLQHSDHPLQQLVHKMSGLSASNQIPIVQSQGSSVYSITPTIPSETVSQMTPSTTNKETQSTNPIASLLKQLSSISEKDAKVESVWGTSNVSTVPLLNNSTFNAQHWCSQVGRIGPSTSVQNNGLWTSDTVPTTSAMKTEQQIIELLMKNMNQQKSNELVTEVDNAASAKQIKKQEALRLQEEELLRRTTEEVKKKEEMEKKLEEEKKAKREEEKRKKRQEDEDKLRRIEEEQRRKSIEEAKRKEEERRRKEEEKRRKEEEKELKRKADEEKKKLEQKRKETEEQQALKDLEKLERRKMDTMRRLKEQQVNASSNNKSSLKAVTSVVPEQELKPLQIDPKLQKHLGTGGKPLSKSSSGQVEEPRKQTNERPTVANKQITKSKSTSSVPTQVQKTSDVEKKEKKKKEKNVVTNAWPDQKKITNVKSVAEIQAEEQKQLAKQNEKVKQEKLLQQQQQQQAAAAQAARESTSGNIWNSQNLPWKVNNWPSSSSMNNQVDVITSPKGWTESSRTSANAASYRSQSNTAIASSVNSNKNTITSVKLANSNSTAFTSETVTNTRTKGKKDDPTSKKSSASLTQTVLKNDDLSKWGIKALSNLKPSFDVPTFIDFIKEVDSPNDVMEYVTEYLGDGKEIKNFVKQFLERRAGITSTSSGTVAFSSTTVITSVTSATNTKKSKKKSEENGSAACVRTYAKQPLVKANSLEFTEVKSKVKKNRKKPVLRVDSTLLGFNVTAAPGRINIGDRDYGKDVY